MLQPYRVGMRPERIDRIARALYGSERGGTVEALWAANAGLAEMGAFIPPRTVIQVPDAPTPAASVTFVLPWQ